MTSKVSVIVPVYQAENFIRRCANSVIHQTCPDWELILVDDGSCDASGAICDELASTDSRIQVYHQPNGGSSAARANGVAHASSTYVTFVDADDMLPHDALELYLNKAEELDLDIVQGANTYDSGNGQIEKCFLQKTGIFSREDFVQMIFSAQCRAGAWGSIYRRTLFNEDTFALDKDVKLSEDKYMNLCLGLHAQRIGLFNDTMVYHYIQNGDSVTQTYRFNSILPFQHLYDQMERVLKKAGLYDQVKNKMLIEKMSVALSCCLHNRSLLHETWVKKVVSEAEDVSELPRHLRVMGILTRFPNTLFPLLYGFNWSRRLWNRASL